MPNCETCNAAKTKLNQGRWCSACFRERTENNLRTRDIEHDANITEIAGITMADIEQIPALTRDTLGNPITTGMLLKIIADVIKPINEKLADHERRITKLEIEHTAMGASVSKIDSESKNSARRLTVTETKIKNLEVNNETLKKIVVKQQSHIAIQDKKRRMHNIVIGGLCEDEPSNFLEDVASTDDEKVKLVLQTLGLNSIEFIRCLITGNKDKGPQQRPRFLIVEFSKQKDRIDVKAAGPHLQTFPALKGSCAKGYTNKS